MSTLLAARHDDDVSAALAIAQNRASKIRKLLDDENERCDEIARRFVESLDEDIEKFLKSKRGERAVARCPDLPTALRRIVVIERGLLPEEGSR